MKESSLNKKCMDHVLRVCTGGVYYKHADRFTAGIPDCTFTWAGATSWLEFKHLDPSESIHDQLDKIQLVELLKLQAACHRAWVIAFRRANRSVGPVTVIYAPSALWHDQVPSARERSTHEHVLRDLSAHGVALFDGHDYGAIVSLIHQTH